jgi:FkbM family methyltransferase
MFSQGYEEKEILDYFGDYKGVFADFGSNDGITLSNTHALALKGWEGLCVEPSQEAYNRLQSNYRDNDKVKLFNCAATGSFDGLIDFYESGEHLGVGDVSLLSTVNKSELKRWDGSNNKFSKTLVKACPIKTILQDAGFGTIDFFSVDVESLEIELLMEIDLGKFKSQVVCIEYNGDNNKIIEIKKYCSKFGLINMLLHNAENIILSK